MILKLFLTILIITFSYSEEVIHFKKIGFLTKLTSTIKYSNSQEALKVVINDLAKNINSKFDLVAYDNYEDIYKAYLNEDINIMAIDIKNYLENFKIIDENTKRYLLLTEKENLKLDNYYLIANKNKKIKKINDLKNKSIALKSDDYLSSIYLKKILSKENIIIENRDFFKDYNTVLLKTLFGSYDACIIPSYAYEILKELNPIINDKLVILEKTKEIFTNHLILFNKNYDSKKLIELENRIDIFKNTVKKEEIFTLLNIEDTFFVNIDELSNLHEFYLDYKNLPE